MKVILMCLLLEILPIHSSINIIMDYNLDQKMCQFSPEALLVCSPSIDGDALIILRKAKKLIFANQSQGGKLYGKVRSLKVFESGQITLSKNAFSAFINIKNIELKNNILKGIGDFAFLGLQQLLELDLSENNLEELEQFAFAGLSSLKKLDLSSNILKSIPKTLFHKLPLEELTLRNNRLQTIQGNIFDNSSKLKFLDLSYNNLSIFDASEFSVIQELKILYLNYNNIKEIKGDMLFSELTFFRAQHNEISNISSTLFTHCPNLIHIDLSYNHFYNLTEAPFLALKHLRLLNVKENLLDGEFKQLKKNTLVL